MNNIIYGNNDDDFDQISNNWMCRYNTNSNNEFISGLLQKTESNKKKRSYSDNEQCSDDEPSVLQEESESEQFSEEEVKEEVYEEEEWGEGEDNHTLFDPEDSPKSEMSLCDTFFLAPIVKPNPIVSLPIQKPTPIISQPEKETPSNESNFFS